MLLTNDPVGELLALRNDQNPALQATASCKRDQQNANNEAHPNDTSASDTRPIPKPQPRHLLRCLRGKKISQEAQYYYNPQASNSPYAAPATKVQRSIVAPERKELQSNQQANEKRGRVRIELGRAR